MGGHTGNKYLEIFLTNAEAIANFRLQLGEKWRTAQAEAYEGWCEWERAIDAECEAKDAAVPEAGDDDKKEVK